jgi:hypothetical protein
VSAPDTAAISAALRSSRARSVRVGQHSGSSVIHSRSSPPRAS